MWTFWDMGTFFCSPKGTLLIIQILLCPSLTGDFHEPEEYSYIDFKIFLGVLNHSANTLFFFCQVLCWNHSNFTLCIWLLISLG